jgi:hypothetical protein
MDWRYEGDQEWRVGIRIGSQVRIIGTGHDRLGSLGGQDFKGNSSSFETTTRHIIQQKSMLVETKWRCPHRSSKSAPKRQNCIHVSLLIKR